MQVPVTSCSEEQKVKGESGRKWLPEEFREEKMSSDCGEVLAEIAVTWEDGGTFTILQDGQYVGDSGWIGGTRDQEELKGNK